MLFFKSSMVRVDTIHFEVLLGDPKPHNHPYYSWGRFMDRSRYSSKFDVTSEQHYDLSFKIGRHCNNNVTFGGGSVFPDVANVASINRQKIQHNRHSTMYGSVHLSAETSVRQVITQSRGIKGWTLILIGATGIFGVVVNQFAGNVFPLLFSSLVVFPFYLKLIFREDIPAFLLFLQGLPGAGAGIVI